MVDYADYDGPDGSEDNMGGTQQLLYYAPVRDFLAIQEPSASPSAMDDLAEISTTHTFKTGKCWKKLYLTMDTGEGEDSVTGDRDARGVANAYKGRTPGQNATLLGMVNQMKNDRFIVLIPLADGTLRQVGSKQFYAEIVGKVMSGKNSGGYRGVEWSIQAFGPKNLVYSGTVTLTPAA